MPECWNGVPEQLDEEGNSVSTVQLNKSTRAERLESWILSEIVRLFCLCRKFALDQHFIRDQEGQYTTSHGVSEAISTT